MSQILLYEPRVLLRSLVQHLIEGKSLPLWPHQISMPYIADIRSSANKDRCVLVGIGGVGTHFAEMLRLFRYLKMIKVKTLVWIPSSYLHLAKLLQALGVNEVITEEALISDLTMTLQKIVAPWGTVIEKRRVPDISQTELDILLQFANGLSAKEISVQRGCCYKTVFSWKHNICAALDIKTPDQWLTMLAEMAQISTLYQQR